MGCSCSHVNLNKNEVDKSESCQNFDLTLCQCLDYLGYSQEMIIFRRDMNKKLDEIHNGIFFFPHLYLTAGGKGEGIALYFESDIDRLRVLKNVLCVENVSTNKLTASIVLHLDNDNCSPGYTRLRIFHVDDNSEEKVFMNKFMNLKSEDGNKYISNQFKQSVLSEVILRDINGDKIYKIENRGPAERFGNQYIKYDFVLGISCVCPRLLLQWTNRERKFGWPDPKLIKSIQALEAHVVPVANVDSKFPTLEWRICFTKAEMLLVQSLNEYQIKILILLKLLAKSVLSPLCSNISTYIIKNVIFWIVEQHPKESFSQNFIVDRIVDALIFLKAKIETRNLQSYMITERNLLQGRITDTERKLLVAKLDELIGKREGMFLYCDKLHDSLQKYTSSKDECLKEAKRRNYIEKLVLESIIAFRETSADKPTEDFTVRLKKKDGYSENRDTLLTCLMPDKEILVKNGEDLDDVLKRRLYDVLNGNKFF